MWKCSRNSLNANILPFILRGIKLIGIDSVYVDHNIREDIWSKLANEWNIGNSLLYNEIGFEEFYKTIDQLFKRTTFRKNYFKSISMSIH